MTPFNSNSETFTFNSKSFISQAWSPMKAAKRLPSIGKAFAVPISFLVAAGSSGNPDDLKDAIPQAIFMLFDQLEEQDCEQLFKLILTDVWNKTDNRQINLEEDLANIDQLLELLASVLNQHYGCLMTGKGFMSLFQTLVPLARLSNQV